MNFSGRLQGLISAILRGTKALVMAWRLCASGAESELMIRGTWGRPGREGRGGRRARLSNATKRVARGESSRVPEHEKTVVVPSDDPAPGIGLKRRGSFHAPSHRRIGSSRWMPARD